MLICGHIRRSSAYPFHLSVSGAIRPNVVRDEDARVGPSAYQRRESVRSTLDGRSEAERGGSQNGFERLTDIDVGIQGRIDNRIVESLDLLIQDDVESTNDRIFRVYGHNSGLPFGGAIKRSRTTTCMSKPRRYTHKAEPDIYRMRPDHTCTARKTRRQATIELQSLRFGRHHQGRTISRYIPSHRTD
jgi:hypothetical protein